MNKFTTTKDTTVAEALNNMANEFATTNEMLNTLFQLVLAEKAKSDARHEKYAAEEAKRDAERLEEEEERRMEKELKKLELHVGQKFEILELGKKDSPVKVGDVLEVTNINLDSWSVEITLTCGEHEQKVSEDAVKKMIARRWLKQL